MTTLSNIASKLFVSYLSKRGIVLNGDTIMWSVPQNDRWMDSSTLSGLTDGTSAVGLQFYVDNIIGH